MQFKIESEFSPTGDQPQAIDQLVDGINTNEKYQTNMRAYYRMLTGMDCVLGRVFQTLENQFQTSALIAKQLGV